MSIKRGAGSLTLRVALLAFLIFGISAPALASVGDSFSFGSRSAALAGASVSGGFDTFAAYANPAGLALPLFQSEPERRLSFSWGVVAMEPQFTPIRQVTLLNDTVADTSKTGDVDLNYRTTMGQVLGASYRLFPGFLDLTFGLTMFLPFNHSAFIDTGETSIPEYPLYRARTQRPQYEFAFGANLGRGFRAGFGMHLAYGLIAKGDVFLQTNSGKPSSMRTSSVQKPKIAPFFGLLYQPPDEVDPSWSAGLVVRLPVSFNHDLELKSGVRLFETPKVAFDFSFNAQSALFYDPTSIELGGTWRHSPRGRLYLQGDYQLWSHYRAPAMRITSTNVADCQNTTPCTPGIILSSGGPADQPYRDIFIPRVGEEIQLSPATQLRFGYAFRPGIVRPPATGSGNLVDPSKHMLSAGLGFLFRRFLSVEVPCRLDFHLAFHKLIAQDVSKSPSTEIGAPGYTAGGSIWGGGSSLSVAF